MIGTPPKRSNRGTNAQQQQDDRARSLTSSSASHLTRATSAPQRTSGADLGVVSRPPSPYRTKRATATGSTRPEITQSRMGAGAGSFQTPSRLDASVRSKAGSNRSQYSWRTPGSPPTQPIILEGLLKKRGGRINTWTDRYFILRENTLEQYGKGEDASSSEPKHCYELNPCCSVSEIKDARAGGRPLFYLQLEWPTLSRAKEEGDGDSGRSGQEGDERDSEPGVNSNLSPPSDLPTPLDSPTDAGARGALGLGYVSEDGELPPEPPAMERADSSGSLTEQRERRLRRPRCNTTNGASSSGMVSPVVLGQKRGEMAASGGEDEEMKRNETIEGMVAAHRETETRIARFKRGELEQLSEYEREKMRRQGKKKDEKKGMSTTNQAVAATAVGVSWLTAGIATGGLVVAGTLVAAGITVGSVGAYNKYKSIKNPNGSPSRVRLASDKVEVVEQWRNAILEQLANLRAQPRRELEKAPSVRRGLGLGIPGWTTPPEGPPPALKAIDLRVVDDMLGNATWISRGVMHGLPILEQDVGVGAVGDTTGKAGGEVPASISAGTGWGLGGVGPVLKTQIIVRASPLETFVALMGAPKHSMNAVMSGTFAVQTLDDHSDVVRLCLRPTWLKVAWASPRDFCLARYWHMAEDGCYIVTFSSMEHPLCPVDPAFVRGEAQLVYTISPRSDSLPGGHASAECLLSCHVQVDPKGWVWRRLGIREMYTSQVLLHVLEVRNVIETERFIVPRINLRPDSPTGSGGSAGEGGVGPRSPDGRPFLFEVLGAPEGREGVDASGWAAGRDTGDELGARGLTSLENVPPPALDPRMWTEANGADFSVRGPSYLTTRVKVSSAKQMFRLRAVDLFVLPEPSTHLAKHPGNRVQLARKAGENAFVWVLQLMVPGPPHYAFVCYFTPGVDNWADTDTPFGKLATRVFFGDDDDFRDQRLKLIPKIVEGNWVVKRAAGTTPAILGTKLKQHHFKGDNYLETDLEIASSSIAANITRLCTGYAKALVVDMVWTIQGNTEEELPEVALGGVRINHLDLLSAKPFDPSALPRTESDPPQLTAGEEEATSRRRRQRRRP